MEYLRRQSNDMNEDNWNKSTEPKHNIRSNTHILPVYLMLMGMAIEDLSKGIMVARKLKVDINIIDDATLDKLEILGHRAPALIKNLGISITDTEKRLLNDANEHLIWSGRYAAPAKWNRQIPHGMIMDMTQGEIKEEQSLETLMSLYKRLRDIYLKESVDPRIKAQCLASPHRVCR